MKCALKNGANNKSLAFTVTVTTIFLNFQLAIPVFIIGSHCKLGTVFLTRKKVARAIVPPKTF